MYEKIFGVGPFGNFCLNRLSKAVYTRYENLTIVPRMECVFWFSLFFFQGKKLSIRAPMSKPQNKVGPGEAKGRGIPFFPCPSKVKKSQWLGLSGRKIGALPPAVAEHCPKHSCSKDYCRGSENVPNLPSQGWKALALISQLGDLVDQHCSTSSRDKLGLIFACLCGSKAIQQVPTYFEPKIP